MKLKVHAPKFTPVTLTITIESEEELKELWHRFNISLSTAVQHTHIVGYPEEGHTGSLWETINDLCLERSIRKA